MSKSSKKSQSQDDIDRAGYATHVDVKESINRKVENASVPSGREPPAGKWVRTTKGAALTTKVRKVGRSSGVILAKDVLERYKMHEGDELHVIEEQDGIKLTPYDPAFDEQMDAYRKGARKFRNALRELAK